MTALMLDTSVCIDLLRGDAPALAAALPRHRGGPILVSAISVAELRFGEARRANRRQTGAVDDLLAPFEVVAFDAAAALAYGPLRAALEGLGRPIGPLDTLIAAHALSVGATVLTGNLREFRRVPGLRSAATLPAAP
ncbi:MAG: type II toxin-antitoxin system VapC family toxin [Gemmatimonadaceae bacterium]